MDTAKQLPAPGTRSMTKGAVFIGGTALLASMAFFGFDVFKDILDHGVTPSGYTTGELIHLMFEMLAVIGLGYAVFTLRAYLRLLQRETERSRETIHMMRGHFDEVLHRKFAEWGLTAAERDVTLLIIKGLSVADLAAARNTAQGTIKAQSTSIFRKIGVGSKAELMSTIIDEFLGVQAPSLK